MNKSVEPVYSVAQHRGRYVLTAVALVVLAGALGCCWCASSTTVSPATCTTCPPSSLRPQPRCGKRAPALHQAGALAIEPSPAAIPVIAPLFDMPHNGLSPAALANHQDLLQALARGPLAPDRLTGAAPGPDSWLTLLARPNAAELAQYVVSCALDPCDVVQLPPGDALASMRQRFPDGLPGELGLCGAVSSAGLTEQPWTTGRPSAACLERVASCVLARVNAVEARVTISMRGEREQLRPRVPVETQFRENHGTPIQSFQPCDRMCLQGDPLRRNCDWEPRYVGQCVHGPDGTPGRTVQLARDPAAPGRIRICKGLYGCDDRDPAPGAGASTAPVYSHGAFVTFPTYYGGQQIAQSRAARLEFECPDNGPLVPGTQLRTGYYSVMLGTLDPAVPVGPDLDVALVAPASTPGDPAAGYDRYPAAEDHVFTYREGGFYGALFPPAAPPITGATGLPRELYACASELWDPTAAMLEDRLCADPASSCFGNQAGRCDAPAPLCKPQAAGQPAPVYAACRATSGATQYPRPYTVYLSHPCDLFATDQPCELQLTCDALNAVAIRPAPGTPPVRPACQPPIPVVH